MYVNTTTVECFSCKEKKLLFLKLLYCNIPKALLQEMDSKLFSLRILLYHPHCFRDKTWELDCTLIGKEAGKDVGIHLSTPSRRARNIWQLPNNQNDRGFHFSVGVDRVFWLFSFLFGSLPQQALQTTIKCLSE